MNTISAVVVDDEINNVELLVHFIKSYCPQIEIIGQATTKAQAQELINNLKPQLVFLDIMLDEGTGFDLLEDITHDKMKVVFVTAFDNYAIKAFKYNALDYVLKPVDIEELVQAVKKVQIDIEREMFTEKMQIKEAEKAVNNNQLPANLIAVPSVEKIDFIKVENIVHLKSEGRYTIFNLEGNKQIVATKNLGEYENLLDANLFFRIHNSYIVNLTHVQSINKAAGNYCEMSNGESLPIAKRRQDQLHRFLKLK